MNITQSINDFITLAVIGIGRDYIPLIWESRGVILGVPTELDNSNPIYFNELLVNC